MDTITRSVPFTLTRDDSGDGLTLSGYAAVFNSPTRIRGEQPREFDEVIAPGAFRKTISERTPVLMFDHGQHPLVGSIPIGQITSLREDKRGLYVEARLHDNWLTQPVRDAIGSGSIDGMSFRFNVPKDKETWDRSGDVPLRTLLEVGCPELGPVVFPAYTDTTVGVRSMLESLDDQTRTEIVQAFRDLARADTDAADVSSIVDQIEALIAQLVTMEAAELADGSDTAVQGLCALMDVLSSLDWFEYVDGTADTPDMGMSMNSATPDQAAFRTWIPKPATSNEPLPDSTQSAGARARVIRELSLLGAIQ